MICPNCKYDNPDGSKFCNQCGIKLPQPLVCPKCGCKDIPLDSKFCPDCGAKLVTDPTQEPISTDSDETTLRYKIPLIWLVCLIVLAIGYFVLFGINGCYKSLDDQAIPLDTAVCDTPVVERREDVILTNENAVNGAPVSSVQEMVVDDNKSRPDIIEETAPSSTTPEIVESNRTNENVGTTPAQKSTINTDAVYEVVEQQPSFPGGASALMQYLSSNIKYPVVAQENGVQGRVVVGFIIEKDGSITNVNIIRGVDTSLDREAVRVISSMPRWIPGKQDGEAVRVKFNVPVTYKLQ